MGVDLLVDDRRLAGKTKGFIMRYGGSKVHSKLHFGHSLSKFAGLSPNKLGKADLKTIPDFRADIAQIKQQIARISSRDHNLEHRRVVAVELRNLIDDQIRQRKRATRCFGHYGQREDIHTLVVLRRDLTELLKCHNLSSSRFCSGIHQIVARCEKIFIHQCGDGKCLVGNSSGTAYVLECEGPVKVTRVDNDNNDGGDDGDNGDDDPSAILARIKFYLSQCADWLNSALLDATLCSSKFAKQAVIKAALIKMLESVRKNLVPECVLYGIFEGVERYEPATITIPLAKVCREVLGDELELMKTAIAQLAEFERVMSYPCKKEQLELGVSDLPRSLQSVCKMLLAQDDISEKISQLSRHVTNKVNEVKRINDYDITENQVDKRTKAFRRKIDEAVKVYLTAVVKIGQTILRNKVQLKPICNGIFRKWEDRQPADKCNDEAAFYEAVRYDLKWWYALEAEKAKVKLELGIK